MSLITVPAKKPTERRQEKKVSVLDVGGKPQRNYSRRTPTQSGIDWKPNPHSAPLRDSKQGSGSGKWGKKPVDQPNHPYYHNGSDSEITHCFSN